jgi:hypothetical protein
MWKAAHIELKVVTIRYGHHRAHLFGKQLGRRKSYNLKNRKKKSFQPILMFLAETRSTSRHGIRKACCRPTAERGDHLCPC